MAWEFPNAPAGSAYPRPDPNVLGNALANLVSSYQGAQQGQQQTEANQRRLDLMKVFAGGVPTNPDGTPNLSAAMQSLAKAGDPNAVESLAPLIQQQQNIQGANAPDPLLGGTWGGSGGDVNTLASNIASRIETKGQADPYGTLGPVTPSGDRAYGKYQVMGDNVPSWTKEVLGVEMTPEQFLASPDAQEMVAHTKLGEYIKETGNPQDAASMWFTGKPLSQGANRTDQNGMTGARYAAIATEGMTPQGGGVQVASLGPTAYADPNAPKIPPGSASAPDLPRSSAAAVNTPSPSGGVTNLGVAPDNAMPKPTGVPAPVLGHAPVATNTAAGIVASAVQDSQGAARLTKLITGVLGVPPNAPLTPDQAARAKLIVQNAARSLQPPSAVAGQGQSQQQASGQPIIPQFPLPPGFKPGQEQQAILAIDQDIARLSRFGPAAAGRVRALEDIRERIASQSMPIQERPGMTMLDPRTGQVIYQAPTAMRGGVTPQMVSGIAEAIEKGDQPPVLTGFYGAGPALRAQLAADGFDLSKHQLEWDAAKKQVTSLNGPQQVRFVGLANSVVNTVDEVNNLAQQMQLSGVPLLNKVELQGYVQTQGNSPNGQLATRYMTAVNTLKEEFANLANGGYAPTEPAWKLADQQINGNYGVEQLGAALTEAQRLIKYRLNAFPGLSTIGPGSTNQYMPGSGQGATPTSGVAPAAGSGGAYGLPAGWSVKVR